MLQRICVVGSVLLLLLLVLISEARAQTAGNAAVGTPDFPGFLHHRVSALKMSGGVDPFYCMAGDLAHGYAYVGADLFNEDTPCIYKLKLGLLNAQPTRVALMNLNTDELLISIQVDPASG